MASLPVSAQRFRVLDGWRGICALLVALHHFGAPSHLYLLALVRNAWLFVDFFFVLSGFVICHAYGERLGKAPEIKAFAIRRFARLWPLHVAVLGAFIALELIKAATVGGAFSGERSPFAIATNLLLIQSLGVHSGLTWNTPSWSISTEFATYLVFAAACAATPGKLPRIALCIGLSATGLGILVFFSRYGMRETFDWGIARCVYGFFLGALSYEIWRSARFAGIGGSVAEISVVLSIVVFLVLAPGHAALEYLATPLFALAVLVFAQERGMISRAMQTRPVQALGRWSYSLYMVHMLVVALLASALAALGFGAIETITSGSLFAGDALTLAYLAAVAALAAFTWRMIERPGQRLGARLARG